jgi:hypothetical protein
MEEYFKFKKVYDSYTDLREQYLALLDEGGFEIEKKMDLYKSFYYFCQIFNPDILFFDEYILIYDSRLYNMSEDEIYALFPDHKWKTLI